jgi:hypothetical protein
VDRPLTVVFLIDALGWEVADRFDFCKELLPERTSLGTVLGYSSAAIPSLLSGCPPSEHGEWSMYRLAGDGARFRHFRFLPKLPHALEWRTRRLIRKISDLRGVTAGYYDLYDIPLHLLGYFDLAAYKDSYLPGGLSRETIFDRLEEIGIWYKLWYYRTTEAENMDGLLSAIGGDFDLLFLYTPDLDALMHRVGIFDKAVKTKLEVYERFIEKVMTLGDKAGREVCVHVISDHGMTDVHTEVDIWGEMERRRYHLGKDYLAFYDSTMARLWCDDRVRAAAAEILETAEAGRELDDKELATYGCLFPDHSYGKTIFLANPGVMIVPSFMGREKVAAMHGYDPEDKYSKGCFLTNDRTGPLPSSILDFKSYLLSRIPGRNH